MSSTFRVQGSCRSTLTLEQLIDKHDGIPARVTFELDGHHYCLLGNEACADASINRHSCHYTAMNLKSRTIRGLKRDRQVLETRVETIVTTTW